MVKLTPMQGLRWLMMRAETDLPSFVKHFCVTLNKDANCARLFPYDRFAYTHAYFDYFRYSLDHPSEKLIILWEKSRQMGASWAVAMSFVWACLFRRDIQALMISQKQELVDDRFHTPNSLMGKCRFIIAHLPPEWRQQFSFMAMGVRHAANNSTIVGETAHPDAGRGGSWSMAEMDEAAFNEYGEDNFKALRSSCYGPLIMTSSPNYRKAIGEDVFSRVRWQTESDLVKVLTTPWHMRPDRDQEWYDREIQTMTPAQVAAELEIGYGKAITAQCFYTWERSLNVRPVPYMPKDPIIRSWDFGRGTTAVWTSQTKGIHAATGRLPKQIRLVDYYEGQGHGAGHYRDAMAYHEDKFAESRVIDIGDPWIMDTKHSNSATWRTELASRNNGQYRIHVRPARCTTAGIENMIENVCRICQSVETSKGEHVPLLVVDPSCKDGIVHLESYGYPTDRSGNRKGDKPVKDAHSHAADALQYLAWDQCPPRSGMSRGAEVVGMESEVLKEYGL